MWEVTRVYEREISAQVRDMRGYEWWERYVVVVVQYRIYSTIYNGQRLYKNSPSSSVTVLLKVHIIRGINKLITEAACILQPFTTTGSI